MSYPWLKFAQHLSIGLSKAPPGAVSPVLSSLQIRHTHIVEHHTPERMQSRVPTQMPNDKEAPKLADPRYIYKHIKHETSLSPKPLEIILLEPVEGVGNPGEIISMSPMKARKNFLLPKLAVYASPENLEKYAHLSESIVIDKPSSIIAKRTVQWLAGAHITVTMNLDVPWVLTAEHVSISMRKAGIEAAPHTIQLPPKPIEGPNLDLQRKFFYVTVTINKKERVNVRCRIHHVTVDVTRKLPYSSLSFLKEPPVAVFPEDQEYLTALFNQRPPGSPYSEPQLTPEMVAQGITSTGLLSKEELEAFMSPASQA